MCSQLYWYSVTEKYNIRVPKFTRTLLSLLQVSEAEVYVDGNEFKFYSKPYYLR